MTPFLLPFEFKEILKQRISEDKDSSHSDCHPQTEPFPFFHLPELVIEKILKEYVPVTDKAGILSQIPEFKPYLELKSLWFHSTLQLFQWVGSITPGWYVDCSKLYVLYYFSVDYFDLTFTIHHFHVGVKDKRVAIQEKIYPRPLSNLYNTLKYFQCNSTLTLVKEKDLLVYEYEECCTTTIFFWIFRPQNIVRWSQSPTLYRIRNKKCFISDKRLNGRKITLVLNDDFTVALHSQVRKGVRSETVYKTLLPLYFQPCAAGIGPNADDDVQHSKCTTCRMDPNCVHVMFKETIVDVSNDSVWIVDTEYVRKQGDACVRPSFPKI